MKENEKRIGMLIHRLDKMFYRNLSAAARQEGMDELTIVHGWIIRYLYENRNCDIYQRDIEKEFGVGRSSVTTTIQIMERDGYLRREVSEKDARLKRVVLTEKGLKAQEGIEKLIKKLNVRTLEGISKEELTTFLGVMEKLKSNLEKQQRERDQRKEEPDDTDIIKRSKGI